MNPAADIIGLLLLNGLILGTIGALFWLVAGFCWNGGCRGLRAVYFVVGTASLLLGGVYIRSVNSSAVFALFRTGGISLLSSFLFLTAFAALFACGVVQGCVRPPWSKVRPGDAVSGRSRCSRS